VLAVAEEAAPSALSIGEHRMRLSGTMRPGFLVEADAWSSTHRSDRDPREASRVLNPHTGRRLFQHFILKAGTQSGLI
jgi:hypothetical protein